MFVLLDLSAAFDTIDHQILLQRLGHLISIRGTALGWFKSYLSERSQFLHVNKLASKLCYGVLQGPVVGPILFIQYMLLLGHIEYSVKSVPVLEAR